MPRRNSPSAIPRASRSSASRMIINYPSAVTGEIPPAGVGEHLPALVSGFPPSSASQESGLGWDSILLGSQPLEKPARLGVKGRSERSLLPEPLQKWKSRPRDPRWYDPFLPDVQPDMPAARQ